MFQAYIYIIGLVVIPSGESKQGLSNSQIMLIPFQIRTQLNTLYIYEHSRKPLWRTSLLKMVCVLCPYSLVTDSSFPTILYIKLLNHSKRISNEFLAFTNILEYNVLYNVLGRDKTVNRISELNGSFLQI